MICYVHSIGGLPPEQIVVIINQLFDVSKSESIPLEHVPEYINQKLQPQPLLDFIVFYC